MYSDSNTELMQTASRWNSGSGWESSVWTMPPGPSRILDDLTRIIQNGGAPVRGQSRTGVNRAGRPHALAGPAGRAHQWLVVARRTNNGSEYLSTMPRVGRVCGGQLSDIPMRSGYIFLPVAIRGLQQSRQTVSGPTSTNGMSNRPDANRSSSDPYRMASQSQFEHFHERYAVWTLLRMGAERPDFENFSFIFCLLVKIYQLKEI
jgi:hypothetical protein